MLKFENEVKKCEQKCTMTDFEYDDPFAQQQVLVQRDILLLKTAYRNEMVQFTYIV